MIQVTICLFSVLQTIMFEENKKIFFFGKKYECLRMPNHNLSLENWHSVYQSVNADKVYNFFDVFMKHCITSCPLQRITISRKPAKIN